MSGEDKSLRSCAADVLQRLAAIETKLEAHVKREDRDRMEIKWLTRAIILAILVFMLDHFEVIKMHWE